MAKHQWRRDITLVGIGMLLAPHGAGAAAMGTSLLEIELSGFVRFLVTGGQLDNARFDDDLSSGLDFLNDTEFHILVKGNDDSTGLQYGARVDLEGDTSRESNADETWLFLKGAWGELRLGDEDGVADQDGMAISAATIAAGTGGLDGDVVDEFGDGVKTYEALGTSDATKIIYRLEPKSGLRFGLSFTPSLNEIDSGSDNGDALALKAVEAGDIVESVIGYADDLGKLTVEAALSGLYSDVKDEDELDGDEFWAAQAGLALGTKRLKVAGSYLIEEVGGIEVRAVTLGFATKIGHVDASINYGQVIGSKGIEDGGDTFDKPWAVILSADVGLISGLSLAGDVAYFDNDVRDSDEADNGWQGVARVALAF